MSEYGNFKRIRRKKKVRGGGWGVGRGGGGVNNDDKHLESDLATMEDGQKIRKNEGRNE